MRKISSSSSGNSLCVALFALAAICSGQATINTVAGNGTAGFSGDGGPATSARIGDVLNYNLDLATDDEGNFYITEIANRRVRRVNAAGVIQTVAGGGSSVGNSDGLPATSVTLSPTRSATDRQRNLYIVAGASIRKVDRGGIISTVAGAGFGGFSGDGGPATQALIFPTSIAVDDAGNIYIGDTLNNRVRKVDTAGIINTIAGNGTTAFSGDGGPATSAGMSPLCIAADGFGNLYIADSINGRVRKVDPSGVITTVAGNGSPIGIASNVPATSTGMTPIWMTADRGGNLFIFDGLLRKVNTAGILSTYAGVLGGGFAGDGGPALGARFNQVTGLAVDRAGSVYVADASNSRIRKVDPNLPAFIPTPLALTFTAAAGANPPAQTVNIASTATPLAFNAEAVTISGGDWLSVTPTSGTTTAALTVSVNAAGLGSGTYRGVLKLTSTGAANTPYAVQVTLTVTGGASATPVIGSVVNASGYQAKLAPNAVFTVFGDNLGPVALLQAPAPSYPASLGGTSVTLTPVSGGPAVTAKMVYVLAGQVAGLLPSSLVTGSYSVRVTYNGQTSAPFDVAVVPRSLGIATANSAGTGTVQATIANINGGLSLTRNTSGTLAFGGNNWTLSPAHPGDTVILWGTGGGADAANDAGSSSGDQRAAGNFIVVVGGVQVQPLYAGTSSGYPGLWQINFTLPTSIQTGCQVPLRVSAGGPFGSGELSNLVSIPIAPLGQGSCL